MMAGDWLQGPYMYALYDAYGFKHEEIAALFVAGLFLCGRQYYFDAAARTCWGSRRWRKG